MSSAAKAEARRKAILARGNDRLAKLTTSVRGEDATYMHDGNQAATTSAANMPKLSSSSPAPPLSEASSSVDANASTLEEPASDLDISSAELQQQFIEALMSARVGGGGFPEHLHPQRRTASQTSEGGYSVDRARSISPFDITPDSIFPIDARFDHQRGTNTPVSGKQGQKTWFQKLIPAIHMLAMGCLLIWFVVWQGGGYSYLNNKGDMALTGSTKLRFWEIWAELARRPPQPVQEGLALNLFWAFTTLQIVLHSTRLFAGIDELQPPVFLSFVLPHMPQQLSTIVINVLRHLQMGAMLLDDIAWLVVAFGFLVYIATLLVS
jgi:hypothetical protein